MNEKFKALKEEILRRAKEKNACAEEYKRAYAAEDMATLAQVIKDNFYWCCLNKIIDAEIIEEYKEEFNANDIWCNADVSSGYLIASDSATVEAYGNATVEAWNNATVIASDSATVEAWNNATVIASGSATVRAWDNATVRAWGSATVEAYGSATVEAYGNATVEAYGSATVEAWNNATVEAYGSAYIQSYYILKCKLSDNAIYRIIPQNKILYPESSDIKFEEQKK